jgi:poly-gamma-glutamate synthesis protein (capsule biosynthesis protein)
LLQGIELYRGRLIFYDLGSIVFHTVTPLKYYPPEVWETMIAEAEFAAGRLVSLRLRPVALNERGTGEPASPLFFETRGLPMLATGAQGRAILDRVQRLSGETKIIIRDDTGSVELDPRTQTPQRAEVRERTDPPAADSTSGPPDTLNLVHHEARRLLTTLESTRYFHGFDAMKTDGIITAIGPGRMRTRKDQ